MKQFAILATVLILNFTNTNAQNKVKLEYDSNDSNKISYARSLDKNQSFGLQFKQNYKNDKQIRGTYNYQWKHSEAFKTKLLVGSNVVFKPYKSADLQIYTGVENKLHYKKLDFKNKLEKNVSFRKNQSSLKDTFSVEQKWKKYSAAYESEYKLKKSKLKSNKQGFSVGRKIKSTWVKIHPYTDLKEKKPNFHFRVSFDFGFKDSDLKALF